MTTLTIKDLHVAVEGKEIVKGVSLEVSTGQVVALMGPNGSGKTTLIKLILGQIIPDRGEVSLGNGVVAGYLSQEHQELASDRIVLDELISDNIDRTESYKLLRRFLLPSEKINQPVKLLSSGEKAKLLLAKIMTSGANFIILDEPTNHLDAESVAWLERFLHDYPGTVVAVTHDRYFLDNAANWILELDRGQGIPYEGNYTAWLDQKEKRLEQEEQQQSAHQKALKAELEWVRTNPKGRQAKSKARLARFEELNAESQKRVGRAGSV